MPKKKKNRIGQFISSCSMDKNPLFLNGATNQKIPGFLILIIFIILASPWLLREISEIKQKKSKK